MHATRVLLCVAAACLTASGCESLGGGLDIVNETDQPLYNGVELIPPDGGRWRYAINECSDGDLTVTTKDGTVFAELTVKWCPGQVWTIVDEGESSLRGGEGGLGRVGGGRSRA